MRRVQVILCMLAITLGGVTPAVAWPLAARVPGTVSRAVPEAILTDFNGDGYADLAIGVPFENAGRGVDAGAVHVLYGSASGLQATIPDDQFWHQDSAGVQDVAEGSDRFGSSVAAGDFNGDGYADLAVGVPLEDLGAAPDAGAVHVLYGSASGLQATFPDDQMWSQDSMDVEDAAESYDHFGSSVGAGDFNGDGYADLGVGVPLEDVDAGVNAGAIHILYGSGSGLQATTPDDQMWSQDSPDALDSAESGDEFGFSAAAGDFNKDGYADLAVGVPFEDVLIGANVVDAGSVSILYGTALGLQVASPDDQLWVQGIAGVQDSPELSDRFGWSASTGDFNGDGFVDLVAGVPFENVGYQFPGRDAGATNVLYGSPSGLQATAPNDQFWHQDVPNVEGLAEHQDWFGYSVATGDFDGDGFDDLAVGVRNEDGKGESIAQSGAVNILYGSAGGLQTARDWHMEQGERLVGDAAEWHDHFGWAVAVGDFDANGRADLAVGVPFEEVGVATDTGAVHVLYSTAVGLQAENPDDKLWTQDSTNVTDVAEPSDNFGAALAGPTSAS